MKILIDTNVILDVLFNREDFFQSSSAIWDICEAKNTEGYISALSIPNIIYIMRKELDPQKTCQLIERITMIFKIVELKESDLKAAAAMYTDDYEDAVQMCQAKRIGADHIVTRNVRDYKNSPVPALTPTEYLNR
ncbi:PIN domain-containing protein [Ruminococcus sp. NK3A76]|uniref:type II toxin-antitoxin system VapC family toxin n=1 Tax=Ruminococcus sp. NK3A76 TaxID=877411 RepID=UPI00048F4B9F|nr:PIN domain-containing protein [Ruminococcus sp. NK3A76]